jgi:hypothetical protein
VKCETSSGGYKQKKRANLSALQLHSHDACDFLTLTQQHHTLVIANTLKEFANITLQADIHAPLK